MERQRMGRAGALLAALLACAVTPAASRADFTIFMDNPYNGTTPAGVAPWGRVDVTTLGGGVVQIKLTNLLQDSNEFIPDGWFFNLDPAKNSSALTFAFVSGQAADTITQGNNAVEPPGQGGDFDFVFSFETANNPNRFTTGEMSVYNVSGIAGLVAEDFRFFSQNENNSFVSVMKVQGIQTGSGSGEVAGTIVDTTALPAPAGVLLGLAGGASFGGFAGAGWLRRRLRK